jgi:hypothetical protein
MGAVVALHRAEELGGFGCTAFESIALYRAHSPLYFHAAFVACVSVHPWRIDPRQVEPCLQFSFGGLWFTTTAAMGRVNESRFGGPSGSVLVLHFVR